MDKTPIEIKLMQDIKFVIDLNEVKTKEIQKKNKINLLYVTFASQIN